MNFNKLAFLFPGQGAQYVGMGKALHDNFDVARQTFEEANDALGFDLKDIIFNGSEEDLTKTEVTQPAILTTSIATTRVLELYGIKPEGAAGLSLGEYSALVTAGAISFGDALRTVKKRGRFMQEAVPEGKGKMLSILGLDKNQVAEVCEAVREAGHYIVPANYNSPKQIVVSGESEGVANSEPLFKEKGAKKVKYLSVSAPFHCDMLAPAAKQLEDELQHVTINKPNITVLSNVTAERFETPQDIKGRLVQQVMSPVLLYQSLASLSSNYQFNDFLDVGPRNTMSKLMKKVDRKINLEVVETPEDMEQLRKIKEAVANE